MQRATHIPRTITVERHLHIMKQVHRVLVLLVDFGDPVVLSEDEGWVVSLRQNSRETQTLVENLAAVEIADHRQVMEEAAIVVVVIVDGPIVFEDSGDCGGGECSNKGVIELHTQVQALRIVFLFHEVLLQIFGGHY